ncbi:MAG: FAD-dependent oxidoreductase [Caulobacterales bacterium]|nr:FAD-dependent oxidoreductase [Caulobacterales bacterium]
MRIAVIGGGISGLGAAWALSRRHEVVLYEADARLGGHANTVDIEVDGRPLAVDTGFIVYNERNYPQLTRLFAHLGVATEASNMSFSVSVDRGRMEYSGSLSGVLAQPSNFLNVKFLRMLRDIRRFHREAGDLLSAPQSHHPTLHEYLVEGGYSKAFVELHLLAMAAAIWSSSNEDIRAFPARSLVRFFKNHALLDPKNRPGWRTVSGGSREYVRRLRDAFAGEVRAGARVTGVVRGEEGAAVTDAAGRRDVFDQVVLATHADETLALLGEAAAPAERAVLSAFSYQPNHAILHCDRALMPRRRGVWSSWNHLSEPSSASGPAVSYWMNRLQNLPVKTPVIVTLNPPREPDPAKVFGRYDYDHPQFDLAALKAQEGLKDIQGRDRLWYCGAFCGYGFHEDGLEAGLAVAEALGAPAPWAGEVTSASPAAAAARPAVPFVAAA